MKNIFEMGRFLGVVLLALVGATASAEMRIWTNSAGKQIKAEYVSSADGKVSIRMENGKIFEVALDQFSEADQKYTKAAAEKAASRGPQSSSRDMINGMAIAAEKEGKRPALEESIFMSVDRSVPAQLSLKAEVLGFEKKNKGTEGGGKRGFLRQTVKFPRITIERAERNFEELNVDVQYKMAERDELVIVKDKISIKNPNFANPIIFDLAGYNDTNGRSVTVKGDTQYINTYYKADFYGIDMTITDSKGAEIYKGGWEASAKRTFDSTEVLDNTK